jgi:hypothetical protein
LADQQNIDVAFLFLDGGDHNLYQLRQWIQPLERLASEKSVKVIYSSNAVRPVLDNSSISGVQFHGQDELGQIFYDLDPKVILYPNQNVRNFYALRFPRAIHVFVSHGESDKAYMSQNTIKRYDLYFAAGEAAKDRIKSKVNHFDVDSRIFQIGRPQSLDQFEKPADFTPSERIKILYAPTWEGVTKATRYSSIASHGLALAKAIIESERYQLTYRPHPLSGSRDAEINKANREIKALIKSANRSSRSGVHYIDQSTFGWQLDYHDLMISDISAIAYDWLSTGNPILLTRPVEKKAVVEEFPLVERLHSISTKELPVVENLIAKQFESGSHHGQLSKELNAYYFRQPTANSDLFLLVAINRAIELRSKKLLDKNFPRLESFVSRGGPLGILRYPNFAIRELLRLAGIWSTAKQLAKAQETDNIFVHLTAPFNGKSVLASMAPVLDHAQVGEQIVVLTNQVTNLISIRALVNKKYKQLLDDLIIVPVANAADCEAVVQKLKPKQAFYLKHHPLNHMLLRLNSLSHTLWKPDLDPLFSPDRSIATYDYVLEPSESTTSYIGMLLDVSRPEISKA